MNATTNHLPSASAVGVTNNQPKENAITTITATQVDTKPTFNFIPDTDVNNRTKLARMAKQFAGMPGVLHTPKVGTLVITEARPGQELFGYRYAELVEVRYGTVCAEMNELANQPFTITAAYFEKDESVLAYAFKTRESSETYYYRPSAYHLVDSEVDSLTVAGVEYKCRGFNESLGETLSKHLGYDGNQYATAERIITKAKEEAQAAELHQAKIDAAYEKHGDTGWRSRHLRSQAQSMTRDEHFDNQAAIKAAVGEVIRLMERELWDICAKSVGKLRTEVQVSGLCDDEADRYGFVTLAEVERYILRRWATDGWSDQAGIREFVAREFVRNNF